MINITNKKVLLLKNIPSNVIEEAIIVLKNCSENIDPSSKNEKTNFIILKEAETIVNNLQEVSSKNITTSKKPVVKDWVLNLCLLFTIILVCFLITRLV